MGIQIQQFIRLRPYVFHLSAQRNLPFIQRDMVLKPANTLAIDAGEGPLMGKQRHGIRTLKCGRQLRDHDPLHAGNISFLNGWTTLSHLVSHLDNHVFFWPGWDHGPIQSGRNHFLRYKSERPIILRIRSADLLASNPMPLFCKYNSGAPRCTGGKGSPRGPDIFLPANKFPFSVTNVTEVTFNSSVELPASVQAAIYPSKKWQPLGLLTIV